MGRHIVIYLPGKEIFMEHTDLSRLDLPEERTKLNREQGGYSFYG